MSFNSTDKKAEEVPVVVVGELEDGVVAWLVVLVLSIDWRVDLVA